MASFCFEALIKCISWCLIPQRIQAKVPFEWKTLKAVTICGQKGISVLFTVRAFSSLTAMLIAPSQCGPDEMVVGFRAALRWACAPNGWIRGSLGQAEAWHDTTLLWGWFEVSARKEKGAKQALICPSPAPGLEAGTVRCWGSGCVPEDPRRQREQAGTASGGAGGWGVGCREPNWDVGVVKFA